MAEYKGRRDKQPREVPLDQLAGFLREDEGPLISRRRVEKELNPHPNRHILVKISYREEELRQRAKQAGGKWLPEKRLWQLPSHKAIALGLRSRIVER